MDVEERQKIEVRIHEIDEWLRNLDAGEMTEGALFCARSRSQNSEW